MRLAYSHLSSPVGRLLLVADDLSLKSIRFESDAQDPEAGWKRGNPLLREAARQIRAYFARKLRAFELPLAPEGTAFQRKVWQALVEIPYGSTASYSQIARKIKHPTAVRAVGAANGRNPLPIVIPCHRVIGSNGSLTGFGGGLEAKRLLLDLERR